MADAIFGFFQVLYLRLCYWPYVRSEAFFFVVAHLPV